MFAGGGSGVGPELGGFREGLGSWGGLRRWEALEKLGGGSGFRGLKAPGLPRSPHLTGLRAPSPASGLLAPQLPRLPASVRSPCSV